MGRDREQERQEAIQRFLGGDGPVTIYRARGRSKPWFFRWLHRYREGAPTWFRDRSHRPARPPRQTPAAIARQVVTIRKRLAATRYAQVGAGAIQWELHRLGVTPLPGLWTINRLLQRAGCIQPRAPYAPKGVPYPDLTGGGQRRLHQADLVGPRYLQGGARFYSLHVMDLPTHRVKLAPTLTQRDEAMGAALVAAWHVLGVPDLLQLDNKWSFFGSPRYPRALGQVIRLCLQVGVEPVFIPLGEPWRNGAIERFQDLYDKKFFRAQTFRDYRHLVRESAVFEAFHNTQHRYSVLQGRTPATVARILPQRALPAGFTAPRHRLPVYPGRIHLVRFIRSDRVLDIFGERLRVPRALVYHYVVATIRTDATRLVVSLDGTPVHELPYELPG